MPTLRLIPSTSTTSNSTYLKITNPANAYTNTDSTTYATVTNSQSGTTAFYYYLRGFNFSDVPADAVVDSFEIKLKIRTTGTPTNTAYRPYLTYGTTTITGNCAMPTSTVQTLTFTGVTAAWTTIVKSYGSTFGIRVNGRRADKNTAARLYVYGAEIVVDYHIPTQQGAFLRQNGSWVQASEVYRKSNGVWTPVSDISTISTSGKFKLK